MSHNIFLSYSRKDSAIMQRIRDDLRTQKLTVWTDEFLVVGTPKWEREIERAIKSTGCLIVLLSPDAYESEWVGREIAYAQSFDKRIYPVLVRGNQQTSVPIALIKHQRADITNLERYKTEFQKLVSAIRVYLNIRPEVLEPIPLSVRSDRLPLSQQNTKAELQLPEQNLDKITSTQSTSSGVSSYKSPLSTPNSSNVQPIQSTPELMEQPTIPKSAVKLLVHWNPLVQFQLLWWLLIQPEKFVDYREKVGEKNAKKAGAWLASTLIWLPLLIPTLASALHTMPLSNSATASIQFTFLSAIIMLAWLFTALFGDGNGDAAMGLAFVVSFAIAFISAIGGLVGIALFYTRFGSTIIGVGVATFIVASVFAGVVAFGIADIVAGIIAFGVAFGVTVGSLFSSTSVGAVVGMIFGIFGVMAISQFVIENNFETHRSSSISKFLFILVILSYTALVWIYLLGGWHFLSST